MPSEAFAGAGYVLGSSQSKPLQLPLMVSSIFHTSQYQCLLTQSSLYIRLFDFVKIAARHDTANGCLMTFYIRASYKRR